MIKSQLGTRSIVIAPAQITNGGTSTGYIDTAGADYVTLDILVESTPTTNCGGLAAISVLEATTSNGTGTTITADATGGTGSASVKSYFIDLRGHERYIQLSITGGTHADDDWECAAMATLTRQVEAPGATTDMADTATIVS